MDGAQAALQGVLRALPVAVHRPGLVDESQTGGQASDPFAALDAPLGLATNTRAASREAESRSEFRALRSEVGALPKAVVAAGAGSLTFVLVVDLIAIVLLLT